MSKINNKDKNKIVNVINKSFEENFKTHNFNKENTLLDFSCKNCNSKYQFDVMKIFFDSLHNKEKYLVNPICPYCNEREKFSNEPKTLHFLSYLFNSNYMEEALFHELEIKELFLKYPNENIKNIDNFDELGLLALERGDYPEVFRIFTQFIYINHHHHLGFEFISYAFYENREFEKSLFFMEKALERAQLEYEEGALDSGILAVMKKNHEYMKRKQIIFRWWENL